MNKKRLWLVIFASLVLLTITSCRYVTIEGTEQLTYEEFRESQLSFDSSDGAMRYVDQGEGDQVILLLHGIPTSSWLYRKMVPELVAEGYRVIAPDMLGFGGSDNPEGYEIYEPDQHAKRILELMDHLEIPKWTHVMHDAGGLWTWSLAEQAPERLENLVILNTIIFKDGFNPPVRMEPGRTARFAMRLYERPTTSKTLLNQLFLGGLKNDAISETSFEAFRTPLLEGKTRGMYQFFTSTCNELKDFTETLKKVDAPTAVVWGSDDEILQWSPQSELVQSLLNIKDEHIHVLDAGHFLQEEAPELVNKHILALLKS